MTSVIQADEKTLLLQLRQGDHHAFEKLYHSYKLRIARNLYRLLKSDELAEEMMQEFFLKIWENRSQIDPEKSFRAYLFRISENMVYDFFRKASRDSKLRAQLKSNYIELYTHIEEGIFNKENKQRLSRAIELLPPQRRQIFILCKLEGKSYKEVSELLGISPSTINNQLLQANKFLKRMLSPDAAVTVTAIMMALLDGL